MSGKKKFFTVIISALLALSCSIPVVSTPYDWWDIYYVPGAPDSVSNQDDRVYVSYYAGGFVADNISIYGTNGCWLTLTAENAGGMSTKYITNTSPFGFATYGSTAGDVIFRLTARSGYQCSSDGRIRVSVYTG